MSEPKTSIFKRPDRDKKTRRVDALGNPIIVRVRGGWTFRIRYVDHTGLAKTIERSGYPTKTAARDDLAKKLRDIVGRQALNVKRGESLTFNDLAEICESDLYKEAVLDSSGKVSVGVKSHISARAFLRNLKSFFGPSKVSSLTSASLFAYKEYRVKQGVKLSTVNRELGVMRRMLSYAVEQEWLLKNIFSLTRAVIDKRDENARERILTREEEARLLESCQGKRSITYTRVHRGKEETITANVEVDNPRLKAMILISLDSGLRRGEILNLAWSDLDFENSCIYISAAKTGISRIAPFSDRSKIEMRALLKLGDNRPFPDKYIRRSFKTAARLAKIEDITFHDLRRTWVTRRSIAGGNAVLLSKVGGHSVEIARKHYLSIAHEDLRELTNAIDSENRTALRKRRKKTQSR